MLTNISKGVNLSIWYDWRNDGNTYPMQAEYDWIRYYELDTHPNDWDEILFE
ncbi:MAG: hypothetical protein OCC49_15950 [Fibrobacterales bacterium]